MIEVQVDGRDWIIGRIDSLQIDESNPSVGVLFLESGENRVIEKLFDTIVRKSNYGHSFTKSSEREDAIPSAS